MLRKRNVACGAWQGKRAVVQVVDQATGPWGHINFGGIYADPHAEVSSKQPGKATTFSPDK